MFKRILISVIVLVSLHPFAFSQKKADDNRLRQIIAFKGQAEVSIPYPGISQTAGLSRNFSISSATGKSLNIKLTSLTAELFISGNFDYKIIETDHSKGLVTASGFDEVFAWDSYPSYSQYDSIMRYLADSYPSICRLDTIGTSIQERLILALKISDNCGTNEPEPGVFYTSTIHGDETAGFVLMLRFAEYLLLNYGTDPGVKLLVDSLQIWINPLANPDGTYRDGNVISSPVRANSAGYDLNRNFPDPLVSNNLLQQETEDMISFMKGHKFVLSANFHSGTEVVNYPWDRWSDPHPDEEWFYNIGRQWADTVHLYSPTGYMDFMDNGVTNGYDWYQIYGGRQDYVTYSLGGREVTVEIDSNYVTPAANLSMLWDYNFRSFEGYLRNAIYGIHGKVIDALTGKSVKAKISIEGHDKDNSEVFSDSLTGNFVRLIAPGLYDLKISANGYRDTVARSVQVIEREQTTLIMRIEPGNNPSDSTRYESPYFYPNPSDSYINAVLPAGMKGKINIRILDLSGREISDYDTETSESASVLIDLSHLHRGTYFVRFTSVPSGGFCTGTFIVSDR